MFRPESQDHHEQCLHLWRTAFFVDEPWCANFRERVGWDIVRCEQIDGRIAASVAVHDFGQFFGGRRLACAGVALVTCSPEFRSRGITRSLLSGMLREQHAAGVPLSALYPSTRTLYRRLGYETAGTLFRYTIPLNRIDVGRVQGEVRRLTGEDFDLIRELHGRWLRSHAGLLDRNEFLWHRIRHGRDGTERDGFVILIDGEPRGYFYYQPGEARGLERPVEVADLVILDAAAGRRFLAFMHDLRATLSELTMWSTHNDPVLMLLNEQRFDITLHNAWMMRLIDVQRAIEGRGYPQGLDTELQLTVHLDEVITTNNGQFVLRVKEGRAELGRRSATSGSGLTITIRGLAALYSGHLSAQELSRAGLLECSDQAALALATAIFAGPQPRLADWF